MVFCWLIPVVCGSSFVLTAVLRRYALARSMLDIPNDRSSHTVPTPRGGGVSMVVVFLASLGFLKTTGMIDLSFFIGTAGAGLLVAIIGFMDDHGHIAPKWRLLGHFGGAIWVLFWAAGLAPIEIAGHNVDLSWPGNIAAVIYLAWMLNLYNFMDGIDGIASVQAITVCLGACVLYWMGGHYDLVWGPLLLASAALGFLFWNFPPAKIFMGDAASGFLGIMLGAFSLQAAWAEPNLLWSWIILMGVFIVDATFTLLNRLLRGDKIFEAHRSHAYQYAARQHGRHLPVTLATLLINVFWLFPIALSVNILGLDGALGVVIAYLPLIALAIRYRAGKPESTIAKC
ncbi:glycosyltransferase family 4 protein [Pseudomonas sp. SWRI111]|uniref:MraY family glycosyltransferase n=1 Tax=Pseudomonas sp. SWRI111 TaxID=2745507 RepID=UPI0016466968|nr:glycosyltransferase family 4 protein [Pseudomonas sp. SWRI111]MBC3207666.1 glycosyltransferase family 4 protein [Pseudomonas sp. SWRI111]